MLLLLCKFALPTLKETMTYISIDCAHRLKTLHEPPVIKVQTRGGYLPTELSNYFS